MEGLAHCRCYHLWAGGPVLKKKSSQASHQTKTPNNMTPWPLFSTYLQVPNLLWVLALALLNNERWGRYVSQTNPFLRTLFMVIVFIIVVESKLGHTATKPTKNAVDSMLTTESTVTEQDKGPCTIVKEEKKSQRNMSSYIDSWWRILCLKTSWPDYIFTFTNKQNLLDVDLKWTACFHVHGIVFICP